VRPSHGVLLAALVLPLLGVASLRAERVPAAVAKPMPPPRPPQLPRPASSQPAALPAAPTVLPEAAETTSPRGRENPGAEAACLTALQRRYGEGVRRAVPAAPAARGNAACAVTDPVTLSSLKVGAATLAFEPSVTLSCEMATRTAAWLFDSVGPLTRGVFNRELAGLRVGGGHECRLRNRASTGAVSEHATARALDIFAFVLAGPAEGAIVKVERPENETQSNYVWAVRQSACGAFSTSLGPGADAAHANHLHVDIQSRRSPATRFCQ